MQRLPSRGEPAPLHNSKSFQRHEPVQNSSPARSRSSTLGTPAIPTKEEPTAPESTESSDIFETRVDDQIGEQDDATSIQSLTEGHDELPIEIQSLLERFLESLAARVHPAPLSVDRLSELYQDFYEHAYSQINTHIASLAIKISRDASPTPSVSSAQSSVSRGSTMKKPKPPDRKSTIDSLGPEHQMLTASEVSNRRKARRQLEIKRLAMEEAVERSVCEKVYPRIWRHQSTDDEARDEKLRSRAAALNVVGVDLKELLSTALSEDISLKSELQKSSSATEDRAYDLLSEARASLERMNGERFPLGKLNQLTAAHKHIVEALQQLFPSASSADEVLPTLIYSIITAPPETNSVISNFNFIQRFRATSKIDGETAYCLTNLEAAISFLENVDLSSIRADELPQGPAKSPSQPSTPRLETPDPLYRGLGQSPAISAMSNSLPEPSGGRRHRGLSNLRPLEAASDAVSAARSGADNIQTALDGGFRFLFGRLKEIQLSAPSHGSPTPSAPRTLEEARKLVTPDEADPDLEERTTDGDIVEAPERPRKSSGLASDRVLEIVGGRLRDRSVDSSKSGGSAGKGSVLSAPVKTSPATSIQSTTPTAYNPVEIARNFSNSINPLKSFSGMAMIRGFGRQATPPTISPSPNGGPVAPSPITEAKGDIAPGESFNGVAAPGFDWSGVSPPLPRFVDCKDARELNHFDVELLLRDYQRLVGAIRAATAPAPT